MSITHYAADGTFGSSPNAICTGKRHNSAIAPRRSRKAIAIDPQTPAVVLEQLLDDPNEEVRQLAKRNLYKQKAQQRDRAGRENKS